MKTNSFNLSEKAKTGRNGVQFVYVLDCIRNSTCVHDYNVTFANDYEAIKFFFDRFDKQYNYENNKKRLPMLSERIGEFLQGLPDCMDVIYWHDEILNIGIKWGILTDKEGEKADRFCEDWFKMLGYRLIQVAEKLGINTFTYNK